MNSFKKRLTILRHTLIGKRYFNALQALEFAHDRHDGFRKDGITPSFDHQVSIALHALTLPDIVFMEELISTIMLHDVREDKHVSDAEIRGIFTLASPQFIDTVANAVENMTKEYRGFRKDDKALFEKMSMDIVASVAKLCDRVHNLQTMVGVFSHDKQLEYISEVHELFLPMLKKAKRNFPHQTAAYENLKHTILSQIHLISAIHKAS